MVSFKIGKEKEKGVFRLVTIVGQRKKFPMRNRTSNLRIPRYGALPLSHRDSGKSHSRQDENIFLYFFTKLKTYLLSYSNDAYVAT